MNKLDKEQAETVAKAIAYGLQDSLRETPSPAPVRLFRINVDFKTEGTKPRYEVFKDGGSIHIYSFSVDLAEHNAIVEAIHRLNRKGIVANEDVDQAIAAGYQELKELHYPSTKG